MAFPTTPENGEIYEEYKYDSSQGAWVIINEYDSEGNLEINGAPIIESGSNSDGEWTRWSDGTQICAETSSETVSVDNVSNYGGYFSHGDFHDYPKDFSSPPHAVSASNDQPVVTNVRSAQETRYQLIYRSIDSKSSDSYYYRLIAYGRWK